MRRYTSTEIAEDTMKKRTKVIMSFRFDDEAEPASWCDDSTRSLRLSELGETRRSLFFAIWPSQKTIYISHKSFKGLIFFMQLELDSYLIIFI